MSDDKKEIRDLEIFELCEVLAEKLHGEKEAIADIKLLYERHPEMFEDIRDVFNTISKTAEKPEIIIDNPQYTKEREILSAKKLDNKKMGEIIIKNDKGTNVIFHANKKRAREFKSLLKKQQLVETPTPSTPSYNPTRGLTANDLLSSSKEHSTVTNKTIIPQNSEKKPFKPTKKDENFKDKDIER